MLRSADISDDGLYRYTLSRIWSSAPVLIVVGLNPSTADAYVDDNTITRCINFAITWGCGGLVMLNMFAFRATEPADMKAASDPIGPYNDQWILNTIRYYSHNTRMILAAWGADGDYRGRNKEVMRLLGDNVMCLKYTSKGHPWHPLYVKGDTIPQVYKI